MSIRAAKIYKKGRLMGVATSKSMSLQANDTVVATDAGNQVAHGVQTGTFSFDFVTPIGDDTYDDLFQTFQKKEIVTYQYGVVGRKIYSANAKIDSLDSTGETATGQQTGSVTITITDQKVSAT